MIHNLIYLSKSIINLHQQEILSFDVISQMLVGRAEILTHFQLKGLVEEGDYLTFPCF